jgi:RHS repeat-associated protein
MAKFTRLSGLALVPALVTTMFTGVVASAAPRDGVSGQHEVAPESVRCPTTSGFPGPETIVQAPEGRALPKAAAAADATYSAPDTPLRMIPGDEHQVAVTLRNTTAFVWPKATFVLSYHWELPDGSDQTGSANRLETELPADLAPGETVTVDARVKAPPNADIGNKREEFVLRWDMRDRQARRWLSETAGVPTLDQAVTVEHPTSDQLGLEKFYQYNGIPTGAGTSLQVNQYSGNAVLEYNAFTNPSRGLATFARLAYNSLDTSNSYAGNGWSVSTSTLTRLGTPLRFDGREDGGHHETITLVDGDGTSHVFELDKHDSNDTRKWTYESPAGVHLYLQRDGENWTFTSPDRTTMVFDEDGYQTATVDKNGNTLTFHYVRGHIGNRDVKLLTNVVDPAGRRTLTLDYYQRGDDFVFFRDNVRLTGTSLDDGDIVNQLRSITDISGRTITFAYGEDGLLQEFIDGAGTTEAKTFTFFYEDSQRASNPKLTRIVDPLGNGSIVRYFTDTNDKLRRWHVNTLIDRGEGATGFDYADPDAADGSKIDSKVIDANGNLTDVVLDGYGRPERLTNAKGEKTELLWDADNNVIRLRENNGAMTTWRYDQKTGYPLEIRDAEANADDTAPARFGYRTDLDGYVAELTERISPLGHRWTFVYDDKGNLVAVTDPKGNATAEENDYTSRYVYDEFGHLTTVTDNNGNTTTYADYDASGYPQRITDPLNCSSFFHYDATGNVVSTVDAKRNVQTFTFDIVKRPLSARVPKDTATNQYIFTPGQVYDANDNIVKSTAANGAVTTTAYDAMDQPVAVTSPADDAPDAPTKTATAVYDKAGNIIRQTAPKGTLTTDPNDFTTTYRYNELHQLVEMTDPLGQRATAHYDDVGNLVMTVDPKKTATPASDDYSAKFRYDLNHRLVETTDPAGHSITSTYDLDGNVVESTDEDGNVTSTTFDERAMPVEVRTPHDVNGNGDVIHRTTRYAYDQVGNLTRTETPRGVATTDDPDDFVEEMVYDELNRLRERVLPFDRDDAHVTEPDRIFNSYDEVGNLVEVSAPPSEDQSVRNVTRNTYFDNGWTRSVTDPWGIRTEYDYNAIGQQTTRTHLSEGGGSSRTQSWTYHPDGKKKTRSDGGVPVGQHSVVVDNSNPNNTETVGSWDTIASNGEAEGYDYRVHTGSAPDDSFTWKADIPASGRYEVAVRYVQSTATNATYTVEHNGGVATATVDQTQHAGEWVSLGAYEFTEDNVRAITLSGQANGSVTADAVRMVRDNSGDVDAEEKNFEYLYDANDNQTALLDRSSGALVDEYAITYDPLNRADSVEERKGGAIVNRTTFGYDENGNVTNWRHDDQTADFDYDVRDLVSKVTNRQTGDDPDEKVTTFDYTPRAHLEQQVKHNGNTVDFEYYLDGQTRHQLERKENGDVVNEHTLTYDENGNRARDVARKQNADNHAEINDNTYEYTYDPRDRVTRVEKAGDDESTETYRHDDNNNVVEQSISDVDTTFRYDRNRLVSSTSQGATTTYAYDPFGRLSKVSSAGGQQTEKFVYDGFDHTIEHRASVGGGTTTSRYVFDPLDRTVSQTVSGTGIETKTTEMHYLGLSEQVLTELENGEINKSYHYAPHGEMLAQVIVEDDGAEEDGYYGFGPHSDVENITNGDGNNTATYGYTAYGQNDEAEFTGEDRPSGEPAGENDPYNSYRFNTKRFDTATGNYDMGFRDYSPSQNRFLSLDLYNGALNDLALSTNPFTMNRYAFGGGNPISAVEIDGHLFGLDISLSDIGHAALDVVGLIPVVGEVADVANGIWYAAEGNYVDAALSFASAIPVAGYGATAVKAGKYADEAVEAVQAADNVADAARTANRAADAAPPPRAPDAPNPPANQGTPNTPSTPDTPRGPDSPTAPDAPNTPRQPDNPRQPEASSCRINSFAPGTPVLMADGSHRPIEDVRLGDKVVATDPESGLTEPRQVTALIGSDGEKALVEITVDVDGARGERSGTVIATDGHPFWVAEHGGWVEAADLTTGEWLRTPDGEMLRITAVRTWTSFLRVHNLTVEGVHTYYVRVGDQDLLVHNQAPNPVPAPGCNNAYRGPGGQFAPNPNTPPQAASTGTHGNSLNSTRPTVLYQIRDRATGEHLKWGITSEANPLSRYTRKQLQGKVMDIIARGTRKDMAAHERYLTERWPGPLNRESWAGTVTPSGPGPFD